MCNKFEPTQQKENWHMKGKNHSNLPDRERRNSLRQTGEYADDGRRAWIGHAAVYAGAAVFYHLDNRPDRGPPDCTDDPSLFLYDSGLEDSLFQVSTIERGRVR